MSHSPVGVFAALPRTTRGFPTVLTADPKGEVFVYTNGNSVFLRHILYHEQTDVYTEHSKETTVARIAPSGYYVASADITGKVRVWDATRKEHMLKIEHCPLGGQIRDLAWSPDSQRIAVGGEGRERYGHVFTYDSGNSLGEVNGPNKPVSSVDLRPSRPFRLVVGGEDCTVTHLIGPPFKFDTKIKEHSRFINVLRYSPSGNEFASAGLDGCVFIYDGTTGAKQRQLGSPAHKGGIYGLCWSPDGSKLVTSGGDKMVKVFSFADGACLKEWCVGNNTYDMQMGCLWQGDSIISVSLSGALNFFSLESESRPDKVVNGHAKPITALAATRDGKYIVSGGNDGVLCRWESSTGDCVVIRGPANSPAPVTSLVIDQTNDALALGFGIDSRLFFVDLNTAKCVPGAPTAPSQPKAVSLAGGMVALACESGAFLLERGRQVAAIQEQPSPSAIAIRPDRSHVAIGRASNIEIYSLSGNTLTLETTVEQIAPLTHLAYSPDGNLLGSVNEGRRVRCFDASNNYKVRFSCEINRRMLRSLIMTEYRPTTAGVKPLITRALGPGVLIALRLVSNESMVSSNWTSHTAKINSLSWSPDSKLLATGGLDTNVIVWNPFSVFKSIQIISAHPLSQVSGVGWIGARTVASGGADACVRKFDITV